MWIKLKISLVNVVYFAAIFAINSRSVESRAFGSINVTTPRQNLSIETNTIQRRIVETASTDSNRSLKRVFLSNRTVTCNDGSQAGFYLRKAGASKKWVVFLEGGWHCYDIKSCRSRWLRLRHLMTSSQWPETRDVSGLLSPLAEDNPYWYNANHVLVPYCSSDSWSGTKAHSGARDHWRFMGSLIIRQVIADLIPLGLGRGPGSELLLAGSSAGGLGVMLNLDKIKKFLHSEKKLKVAVRGVSDSGWFLDREPYTPGAVAASEAVRQGWKMWEGSLPEACVRQHTAEPWRCYFGHRLYPTLKSPLFVFQWLFDEAQMRADSVGAPVTPQQWNYIHDMGGALRASLDNVTAVFAPSCIGHSVLTKRDWLNIKIDDISLSEALKCWEQSTSKRRNHLKKANSPKKNKKNRHNNPRNRNNFPNSSPDGKEPRRRHNKRNHKRARTTASPNQKNNLISDNRTHTDHPRHHKKRKSQNNGNKRNRNGHKRHQRRHNGMERQQADLQKCSLRLLERCSWPQCNHSCPTLTNPLTGEEIRFLELLASFGLDIEAVATALGVDMKTLNNMDRAELVNLLTQQPKGEQTHSAILREECQDNRLRSAIILTPHLLREHRNYTYYFEEVRPNRLTDIGKLMVKFKPYDICLSYQLNSETIRLC